MVSIILVCSPGLWQLSLFTAVSAVPLAKVVAKAVDAESALLFAEQLDPDVLLADANYLQAETLVLLKRIKEAFPKIIRIVLRVPASSTQKNRLFQQGAEFILDDRNLDQELTQILGNIQAYQNKRHSH